MQSELSTKLFQYVHNKANALSFSLYFEMQQDTNTHTQQTKIIKLNLCDLLGTKICAHSTNISERSIQSVQKI